MPDPTETHPTKTELALASAEAIDPSLKDRAQALIAAYEHALSTNSPRTQAELAEMKELLGE
jgi:hypothetical protein